MIDRIDVKFFKLAIGASTISSETDVDITARCAVCGDSKNTRKARLHLYKKNDVTNINCFNGDCSVHNKSVFGFLKDFYPALIESYKREKFKSTMRSIGSIGSNQSSDAFAGIGSKTIEAEVQTQDLSPYLRIITEEPQALEYLINRGLPYNEKFGKWYYGFQNIQIGETVYPITDSVVIPLYYKSEMYGFYSRNIGTKSFYTYMNDNNIGFKLFNWFNINKSEPVYIYEGIFDCIAGGLPNSIALMGAKLPDARLKELKQPIFVLDNDKTGLLNSLQYAKAGCSVYIQPNEYHQKDMNELMLSIGTVKELILSNLFSGIAAEVRIKMKL